MKLIRAEFQNFRLLRDLSLTFTTETNKKLNVIRAENESGKTTILNALQWALYGDNALPGGRTQYRMHPIDWEMSNGPRVPISVMVDFETKSVRHSRTHGNIERKQYYRIIRSTYEIIRGALWERGPTNVNLLLLTTSGSEPIEFPEARLKEEVPDELREIFFTDGDRALSFIEADVSASTKRDRVREAIESLMGLDIIEAARDRVKKTASSINRKVGKSVPHQEVAIAAEEITELEEERDTLEAQIRDSDRQFAAYDERYAAVENQIEEALAKGNKDELRRQVEQTRNNIKRVEGQINDAHKQHAALFRSLSLSRELAAPVVQASVAVLDELRDEGKIPNSTIPVLEERLNTDTCICGESLVGHHEDVVRRREHIKMLIDQSRRTDELQSTITDLYYGSRPLQLDQVTSDEMWISKYEKVAVRRDQLDVERDRLGQRQKALEARIDQIPDRDIQGLRQTRSQFREQRDRFNAARARYRTDLANVSRQLTSLEQGYHRLLRQEGKGAQFMADLEVAQDIQTLLSRAYERLTTDELQKVSALMNSIFLKMIGSDPSQGAIIQSAGITAQFEITVDGPNGSPLNPDRDLNGASRRALTLAFILALTRVSEVEAPNVIDTPLGMMSGYVKTSVLMTAIRESSQLILFLTRSEIADCEDILDAEGANVITLTNPVHYPVMLVNDPQVNVRTILSCDCNHRQECSICQRVSVLGDELASAT